MSYISHRKDEGGTHGMRKDERRVESGFSDDDILSIVTSDESDEKESDLDSDPKKSDIVENRLKSRRRYLQALQESSSISIISSDDDFSSENNEDYHSIIDKQGQVYRTEKEFEDEINRLKLQSTRKFKDTWDQILEKYASINDEAQSDEIDLVTGKIIVDNGHLKSLREDGVSKHQSPNELNIWSPTYDIDKQAASKRSKEYRDRLRKKELKKRLKQDQMFYNLPNQNSSSSVSKDASPFNTLGKISEDNLTLLSPSPTKKQKIIPLKLNDNPKQILHNGDDESPTKNAARYTIPESPLKSKLDWSISTSSLDTFDQDISNNQIKKVTNYTHQPEETRSALPYNSRFKKNIEKELQKVAVDHNTGHKFAFDSTTKNTIRKNLNQNKVVNKNSSTDALSDLDDTDFDHEYSIVEDPYSDGASNQKSISIYNCAFDNCFYCTGNKLLYHTHLLENHQIELNQLGYPVMSNTEKKGPSKIIAEDTIKNLTSVFPLILEAPSLPLSSNGEPFKCGMPLDNDNCKKIFMTKEELKQHQGNTPSHCSSRTQIYMCPLLGCGFLTDGGYMEWISHITNAKNHITLRKSSHDHPYKPPKEGDNSQNDRLQSTKLNSIDLLDLKENIDYEMEKLFNDSD